MNKKTNYINNLMIVFGLIIGFAFYLKSSRQTVNAKQEVKTKQVEVSESQLPETNLIDSQVHSSHIGKSKSAEATRFNKLGVRTRNNGNIDESIKYFDKAIEIDPNYVVALLNRANTKLILDNYDRYQEALEDSNRAINLLPNFADAYIARSWAYHYLDENELSLLDAQKAVELAPKDIFTYMILGANYEALDQYENAIDTYTIAMDIEPELAPIYYKIAKVYSYMGNEEAVQENCKTAMKLNPNINNIINFCSSYL